MMLEHSCTHTHTDELFNLVRLADDDDDSPEKPKIIRELSVCVYPIES